MRARTICSRPGCANVQPCSLHARKPWDHSGRSRHARGYGSAWDSRRKAILERDGHRCGYCGNRATTVDHRIPKAQGGADEASNLVAACSDCQQRKAAREGNDARKSRQATTT